MKILIIYATTEGQTRKIARFMRQELKNVGHQVEITDATDDPPDPSNYDAILIGASIHIGKYQRSIKHYIISHLGELNDMPSAFFSVCMAVASGLEEKIQEAEDILSKFLRDTGWNPSETTHIAGALKYTQYNYFIKLVMRMIAKKRGESTDISKDHEYTDWDAVKDFALHFANNPG